MFTTAAAITLKSIAPKDNTTETVTSANGSGIKLTFNQEIDPASFDAADYTITPAVTLAATNLGGPLGFSSYETLELDPAAAWAPGTYTFTLKSTAVLKDKLGNSFSPSADQVIHFTVNPNPTPTPHTCL